MQKVVPYLWFDGCAEEAVNFYTSVIKDSKIGTVLRYMEGSHRPVGSVMTINFSLKGQEFTALNGGPEFAFTPAISFLIHCEDQAEVDELWEKLSEGGEKSQCGWLTDRFGVTWQIVPTVLMEMLSDPDVEKARRVTEVMLKMGKLEIEPLKQAYNGR